MAAGVIKKQKTNYIKFLGTAGARFVMINQLRASGGIWVSAGDTNLIIDPGPGSIVRCSNSRPKLNPVKLDGIILTHRHLDHSGDVNVMIEAMTEGGFKKRGVVFCPEDAVKREDSVILKHLIDFPERIEILGPERKYKAGNFEFQTSMLHKHPVETYGLKFKINKATISLMSDTAYFAGLKEFYKSDILILCVVFVEPRKDIQHLSLRDAELLIKELKPKKTILTHFGMTILKANPYKLAESLSHKLGIDVVSAYDGMTIDF
ncbi:MAG: MBL fold metallo-hydrolase [Candidatus Omnitrophota bacterium]|jgi:phosphoribosyl 1,2-cyclic phosphodiesterase|nr:MAG: MBL fold metallo-hydrolase [Candidatus Omnitrophota bacterium]